MKKIITAITFILILGTVNANIANLTIEPVLNANSNTTISTNQNIAFLPSSHVKKSLITIASVQSCLAQCRRDAEICRANGGGRQCLFDLADCRELCY